MVAERGSVTSDTQPASLSVSGVSLVFGRNPEFSGNVLSDNLNLVANSPPLHDTGAGQAARVRTIARTKFDAAFGQTECWESAGDQTSSGTDVRFTRHCCSLAYDEGSRHSWQASTLPMETWNMRGRRAR